MQEQKEKNDAEKLIKKLTGLIKKLPIEKLKQVEKLLNTVEKKALSLKEAAQILDVAVDTVRRAVKAGHIKAFQINKRGVYRIAVEEIEKFTKKGTQK